MPAGTMKDNVLQLMIFAQLLASTLQLGEKPNYQKNLLSAPVNVMICPDRILSKCHAEILLGTLPGQQSSPGQKASKTEL